MRNQPQTLIGVMRAAINQWRRANDWSRETVVQMIVEAHERIGAQKVTGIDFDPPTRDAVSRMKVNAERVFRWLDDETKDSTLLPSNLLPSILEALPMDLRLHCLAAILRPLGVEVRSAEAVSPAGFDVSPHLNAMIKEGAEAQMALVGVGPDAPVAKLEAALKEVTDAREATCRTEHALKAAISAQAAPLPLVRSVG